MPFLARVVNVMIASPSDIVAERKIVREVIQRWNTIHAESSQSVLLPVGWDTHAYPSFGDRPQALINKQVLERCDLLIAIFWTRIGTNTGEAASGMVEEISRHLEAGKPAMAYFSEAPVRPESVHAEQYEALLKFRDWCRERGMTDQYSSLEDFQEKLDRHLTMTVRDFFTSKPIEDLDLGSIAIAAHPRLSEQATTLLTTAARDQHGIIMCARSMEGLSVQAGQWSFAQTGNARDEALWKAAVDELLHFGYIEDRGHSGEVFAVTATGYARAEQLANE